MFYLSFLVFTLKRLISLKMLIRNLRLISRQRKILSPFNTYLTCYLRSFIGESINFLKSNAIKNQALSVNSIVVNYSTNLSENQYEKIVEDTLESLNDYFDELLEAQTQMTNYDLSLSVSCFFLISKTSQLIKLIIFRINLFVFFLINFDINFNLKRVIVFFRHLFN